MTTAVGDIVLDASGLANVNPFTDPAITPIQAGIKVVSGVFVTAGTGGGQDGGFVSASSPAGPVYSSMIEYPGSNNDPVYAAVIDASGNGYGVRCNYGASLVKLVAYESAGTLSGSTASTVVGSTYSVQIDENTNTITAFKDGVEFASAVDVSYTGLKAGVVHEYQNTGGSGAISWGATGYSAATTVGDINTNNEVVPGTTATITGSTLTNVTAVTIGGVSQTNVVVVNGTTVTFTVVRGGNPYNQNLNAEVVSTDGNASITVQQIPEAGTFAVTADNPNISDSASLWTGLVDTVTGDPVTIVAGDQAWVKNPNNLTNLAVDPDGTITADITGDFVVQIWLASEGVWGSDQTVTFVEAVPNGTVSVGTVSTTTTTADITFTYSGDDGAEFEYRLNDGVWGAWTTVTSPIQLTGLTENSPYTVEIRAFNTGGTSNTASVAFTTEAVPVDPPAGAITFGTVVVTDDTATVPFSYDAADQDGFEYRLDGIGAWTRTATSPINLLVLQPNTNYTLYVRAYNSTGVSTENSLTFKTLEQAIGPPLGKIVFAVPTRGSDLIVQQFFYEEGDASYYEYKIDAGAWNIIPFGPIGLQDLPESTSYTISVRPVNAEGTGDTATTTVSTRAGADIIQSYGIKR